MLDWFKWNGVVSTSEPYGIHALTMPNVIGPAERTSSVEIPGRTGNLTISQGDHVYSNIDIAVSCIVDDPEMIALQQYDYGMRRLSKIVEFLRGRGTVSFPNRLGGYYKGRIANQISFERYLRDNPHRTFSVQWNCEPYFYLGDPTNPTTIFLSSGSNSITNPGNIESRPRIDISFNTQSPSGTDNTVDFAFNSDGVTTFTVTIPAGIKHFIIDSDDLIVYSTNSGSDEKTLRGVFSSGDWPEFSPGSNSVKVTPSSALSSGMIIAVTPRWRVIG